MNKYLYFTISNKKIVKDFPYCLGYIKYKKGYIKPVKDIKDRFHIYKVDDERYSVHYDVFISNKGGKHMTLPSDTILQEEYRRITEYISCNQELKPNIKRCQNCKKSITDQEFQENSGVCKICRDKIKERRAKNKIKTETLKDLHKLDINKLLRR